MIIYMIYDHRQNDIWSYIWYMIMDRMIYLILWSQEKGMKDTKPPPCPGGSSQWQRLPQGNSSCSRCPRVVAMGFTWAAVSDLFMIRPLPGIIPSFSCSHMGCTFPTQKIKATMQRHLAIPYPILTDLKPSEVKPSISLNSMCLLLPSFLLAFSFLQVFKSRIFILILSTAQEGGEVFSAQGIIKCSDKLTGLKPDISNRSNHSHQTTEKSSNGIICQHKQKDKYKQTHQPLKHNSHVNLRLWQKE